MENCPFFISQMFPLSSVVYEIHLPPSPVSDYKGPERLYQVAATVQLATKLHGLQVVGNHLALAGLPLAEEVGVYGAPDAKMTNESAVR